MKYLDYKVEVWRRLRFSDNIKTESMIEAVEEGDFSELTEDVTFIEDETLYETELEIHPINNKGQKTIEIIEADSKAHEESVWDNSITTDRMKAIQFAEWLYEEPQYTQWSEGKLSTEDLFKQFLKDRNYEESL